MTLGFVIPVFFVVTGIQFDLDALLGSPTALLVKLPLFLVLFLVARGLPTLLYRNDLPEGRDRLALAFLSATGLPLIVVITTLGLEAGQIRSTTAAALVGAGMVSIVVYPLLGSAALGRDRLPAPGGAGVRARGADAAVRSRVRGAARARRPRAATGPRTRRRDGSGSPWVEVVRARPAAPLSIRWARVQEVVLGTLWFVPLCGRCWPWSCPGSPSRSIAAPTSTPGPASSARDPTALAGVASTVAAAMLTFLGVVFATTLVAIQLASSQYSPRIVRLFVRSRVTQATLGVFLATFVFALNTLVATREVDRPFVPAVTATVMYLLVLATVVMFVGFAHHMVRLLRVQYLVRVTARASHDAVDGRSRRPRPTGRSAAPAAVP